MLSLDPSLTLDIDWILLKSPTYKRVYGDARLRVPPLADASPTGRNEQARTFPKFNAQPAISALTTSAKTAATKSRQDQCLGLLFRRTRGGLQ